jgi:hypothetical protein
MNLWDQYQLTLDGNWVSTLRLTNYDVWKNNTSFLKTVCLQHYYLQHTEKRNVFHSSKKLTSVAGICNLTFTFKIFFYEKTKRVIPSDN